MKKKNKSFSLDGQPTIFTTTITTSAVAMAIPVLLAAAPNMASDNRRPAKQKKQNSDEDATNKFFNQGYNYCDAKVLARFWGEKSPYDAKVRLGNKMLNNGPQDAQNYTSPARSSALRLPDSGLPCNYAEDGGYTYDDANLLASYWGRSVSDAKIKIERALIQGTDDQTQAALQAAKGASTQSGTDADTDATNKFFSQGYTYCDAKVLANFWGEKDAYDAKVRLGNKMLSNGPEDARNYVKPARKQALRLPDSALPCNYAEDGGYTYDDANLLASYWGRSASDAKIKIARALIQGKDDETQAALQRAKTKKPGSKK